MMPDIRFLVFAHVRHYAKILAHVRDHVRRFYGNCRTLIPEFNKKKLKLKKGDGVKI